MIDYQVILEKIKDSIQKSNCEVSYDLIDEHIQLHKRILDDFESMEDHIKLGMYGDTQYQNLTNNDWIRLKNDLKSKFYVAFNPYQGMGGIKGKDQQKRNTNWWNEKFAKENNFYWERFLKLQEKEIPGISRTLRGDTSYVLNNLGDPSEDSFSIFGMVVGYVQSGKTAHYSGVITKAADAGYKLIIVIAGDKNNLRTQTQKRINEAFVGFEGNEPVGVGLDDQRQEKRPIQLTSVNDDFSIANQRFSENMHTGQTTLPHIVVVKKWGSILRNLIKWLKGQGNSINDVPMLIIDDESDYASVNTKEEEDPNAINFLIRELAGISKKSSYIGYTATPFANIFIDHEADHIDLGGDLFPKNFIYALDAPKNYFGSEEILDSPNSDTYINEVSDFQNIIPLKHKKDDPLFELPWSLKGAIRWFVISVVIRNLRGQINKHKSMLIHISRFTMKHKEVKNLVEDYIKEVRNDIQAYGSMNINCKSLDDFEKTFQEEYINKEFYDDGLIVDKEFTWNDIKKNILRELNDLKIGEAHQSPTDPLIYDDDNPCAVIAIGGLSLSRGFTVQGLTVSYFLRNSVFYDTLMQMARWYGYRPGYQDLCRLYMTFEMIDYFTHIHQVTSELMDRFKEMVRDNRTPEEFGLLVRQHPDNILKVTALNKMKNAQTEYVDLKLEGTLRETVRFTSKESELKENYSLLNDLVHQLEQSCVRESYKKSGYLWRNVDKGLIHQFIVKSHVYDGGGFGLKAKMPVHFVEIFIANNPNWDVALFEGSGNLSEVANLKIKQTLRSLKLKDDFYVLPKRQLSSKHHEFASIPHHLYKEYDENRLLARSHDGRNNLLMLYIVQDKNSSSENIVAFGVSFSGNPSNYGGTSYLINKIMQQEVDEITSSESSMEEA